MQSNSILNRCTALGGALFMIFGLTSCGDSHEAVAEDQIELIDEVMEIVDSVKDKASAEEAAEKIKDLEDDFKDLKERMDKLGEPSQEVKDELKQKFEKKGNEMLGKMLAMMAKFQQYPELQEAMSSMKFDKSF